MTNSVHIANMHFYCADNMDYELHYSVSLCLRV